MAFDKDLSNPKKKSLVAAFKRDMEQFIEEVGSMDTPTDLRRAFIARYANKLGRESNGVWANWWSIPIATMYEPNKEVGILYQRPLPTTEETEDRRLALLNRTSLHSVNSFFNVLRQRVSYFHRPGFSRSSGGHYGAYNPEMVQKMLDISRVWFNWCEARPFRLAKKFKALDPQPHDPWHDKIDNAFAEQQRQTKREEFTTPAMRMYLAKNEVRLETILYTDWLTKLSEAAMRERRRSLTKVAAASEEERQPGQQEDAPS